MGKKKNFNKLNEQNKFEVPIQSPPKIPKILLFAFGVVFMPLFHLFVLRQSAQSDQHLFIQNTGVAVRDSSRLHSNFQTSLGQKDEIFLQSSEEKKSALVHTKKPLQVRVGVGLSPVMETKSEIQVVNTDFMGTVNNLLRRMEALPDRVRGPAVHEYWNASQKIKADFLRLVTLLLTETGTLPPQQIGQFLLTPGKAEDLIANNLSGLSQRKPNGTLRHITTQQFNKWCQEAIVTSQKKQLIEAIIQDLYSLSQSSFLRTHAENTKALQEIQSQIAELLPKIEKGTILTNQENFTIVEKRQFSVSPGTAQIFVKTEFFGDYELAGNLDVIKKTVSVGFGKSFFKPLINEKLGLLGGLQAGYKFGAKRVGPSIDFFLGIGFSN